MGSGFNDGERTLDFVNHRAVTDLHRMGTFEGYRRLRSKDKWLRVDNREEWTDPYDPANEADLLRFFDYFLRGTDNGWKTLPRCEWQHNERL
jgi:hypothetical protein